MSWRAAIALAVVLTGCGAAETPAPRPGAALDPGTATRLLREHRPFYVMDARDPGRPTSVDSFVSSAVLRTTGGRVLARRPNVRDLHPGGADQVLDGPGGGARPGRAAVYGAVRRQNGRTWLQYWAFLPDNPQDRGPLRTGRHEGDWEFLQIGLGPDHRPETVTAAQHKWAEGCSWSRVRRSGRRPVVFLANGSHATYLSPGEHGRPWPDPDDEARGDGARVDPTLLALDRQSWRAWAGRWGGSTASPLIPIEATSPVGPAFQDADQDRTPTDFHVGARACGSGAPTTARDGLAGGAVVVLVGAVTLWRRRRRRPVTSHTTP